MFRAWRSAALYDTVLPYTLKGLDLSKEVREDAQVEWNEWERDYLPADGLHGKTVLDVGAGEGETCAFFFGHGARRIVAVEQDVQKANRLYRNAWTKGWDIEVMREPFRLEHLSSPYDFVKVDIEGAEAVLLEASALPPALVMEVHSKELKSAFETRFPQLRWRKRNWFRDLWIAKCDRG